MTTIPQQIIYVAARMFEWRLTDLAGGNISVREGDQIYITPRFSGSKKHWQLGDEDIISGDISTDALLEHPRFSREGRAHLAIYRNFPDVGAVIHAHPFHILPFCAAGRAMEPVLEQTEKFGVTPLLPYAPAHSSKLAENIVAGLRGREDAIRKQAAAVLAERHGIFVAGKDLWAAIDALKRLDWNAWCILAQNSLPPAPTHSEL
ncbi:MAG: class II aldolase/adducin family protein [Anaerolineae bacterium]|nr:class II aldolase/adducin family protein [Anaerolineae bacterium]